METRKRRRRKRKNEGEEEEEEEGTLGFLGKAIKAALLGNPEHSGTSSEPERASAQD